MKKEYITPALVAVELGLKNAAMLSASDGNGTIIGDGGEGDGTDIGVKEITNESIWDNEW